MCINSAGFLRKAFSIVDPFGGSQSFVGGAPIEQTGVDVERVKQVGGGSDHSETHHQKKNKTSKTTSTQINTVWGSSGIYSGAF